VNAQPTAANDNSSKHQHQQEPDCLQPQSELNHNSPSLSDNHKQPIVGDPLHMKGVSPTRKQGAQAHAAAAHHGEKEKKNKFVIQPNEMSDAAVEAATERHLQEREKTHHDRSLIKSALKSNLVCSSLNESEMEALCEAMQFFAYKNGEVVCEQGSMGSHFFIVHSGLFDVLISNKVVNQLQRGRGFGELALIHNCPRSATVKAVQDGQLWGVQRATFRNILKQLSSRNFLENRSFLESVKIFDLLTEAQKNMICNALVVETFDKNSIIVREGEKGDCLYIVKQGTLNVTIQGTQVRQLEKGDYFGERALLYDEPRSATITCATPQCICVSIGRELLGKVLGNLQHVLFRNMMFIALQSSSVFQQFTDEQMAKLVEAAAVKNFDPGETILAPETHGAKAKGVRFLIVLEGELKVTGASQGEQSLSRGQCFGEEYVVKPNVVMAHKVEARTASKVALLTASAFAACLGSSDIDSTLDYNNKRAVVKKNYIFRYLSEQQLDRLIKAFRSVKKQNGEVIVRQGEIGTTFYIIKSGEVAITLGGKQIRTCGKNDYFGERALLFNEGRTASVTARGDVELWLVDKTVFKELVQGPMIEHLEDRIRLQDTKIRFEDLVTTRTVGRGTFGTVKLMKHTSGTRFALKCVKRKTVLQLQQQEHIRLEREIMAENDHPFIVKLVRTFKDRNYLYFLTELVTGGELYDAIRKLGLLTRDQAQFYLASMILAIEYLHERNIAYRDLKPENVLLDNQGYIKLIDFGCAKKMVDRSYTLVGTPHYMAPEVILGKGYTLTADHWAFGVCLFEFMCGPLPFGNDAEDQLEIFRDILTGKLMIPPYVTDQDAVNLMKRLLCRLPEVRIGCSINGYKDIKEHAFFKDFDWDKLLGRMYKPPLIPKGEVYAEDAEMGVGAEEEEDDGDIELEAEYDWDKDF